MDKQTSRTQLLLGAHMSIAGGLEKALVRGHKLGCNTIQMFTKNSNRWEDKILEESQIDIFQRVKKETGINPVVSHAGYLINLASPDEDIYGRSMKAVLNEIHRCEQLGIDYLVIHPGFHKGSGEKYGIDRIADALNAIHDDATEVGVKIALETTAGQGTALGRSLEQIARIIEGVKEHSRLAFCLDTCHMFVAGYDLRTEQNYLDLLGRIDDTIGRENLRVIHLNDSKGSLGSRVDRHEDIGKGTIGTEMFRLIMRDESLKDIPKIIETPGDIENIQLLKSFV